MSEQPMHELHSELVESLQQMLQGHETFKEALNLGEEEILALATYAREMVEQGRREEAQAILEGLAALDPQNAYLHTCLGAVYMQQGQSSAAVAEFAYALRQDPEDIAAHTSLGELHLEEGDLESAVEYLKKAVELDPEGSDPYANRARVLAAVVATVAKEVADKGPEALEEIRERARLLQQNGDGSA